jgi:hypothetical protein
MSSERQATLGPVRRSEKLGLLASLPARPFLPGLPLSVTCATRSRSVKRCINNLFMSVSPGHRLADVLLPKIWARPSPRHVSDRLSGSLNMHEPHAKRKDARAHPVYGSAQDLRRSQAETYARITREHGYVVRLRSDLLRKRTSGETCQRFFQVNPCNPGSL